MSTRAVYSFIEGKDRHHVYKHHDGYPSGAAEHIAAALSYAWKLPRFEPDEFAAGFVAANKPAIQGGGVRLIACTASKSPAAAAYGFASDLEYRYEITAKGENLIVKVFHAGYCTAASEHKLWEGNINDMPAWAKEFERQK